MTERMLRHKSTAWLAVAAAAVTLGMLLFLSSLGTDRAPGTSAQVAPTATPAPECLKDLDVVIVIDKTGSMDQETGGHTRLYWAKQAATALVDGISGGSSSLGPHHVEVITFDGDATAQPVGPALGNSDADAVRAAINNIGDLSGSGDTYIAKGIEGATGDLNAHVHDDSYRVVVLLSDGRNYKNGDAMSGTFCNATHTRRTNTVAAIGPLHDEADTVYTVGVGNQTGTWDSCNPYELDEALLGDIAEGPPGDYTQVIDASTLPAVFQAIAWKIAGRALTQ